ncbi:hypothetical protein ABPG72_019420 [Tetrahymena utriculariae]
MSQKKVLIQEIFSQNLQNNQDEGQIIEEEQKPQHMSQQILSTTIQAENSKNTKKDLLRLEKNYFDNIYNEEKHQNEKQFAIQKMLNQNPQNQSKPDFKSLPKSSIKDRLAQFMPNFKKDTDDLLVNVERQEKMRIDDRNQYEIEQEEQENASSNNDNDSEEEYEQQQEMDHYKHQQQIIELKKKNKEQMKGKKNKLKNYEQDQNPKMIQLDLLLGILEQKNVDDNQEQNSEIISNNDNNNQRNIEQESNDSMSQNNSQNAKIQEIN